MAEDRGKLQRRCLLVALPMVGLLTPVFFAAADSWVAGPVQSIDPWSIIAALFNMTTAWFALVGSPTRSRVTLHYWISTCTSGAAARVVYLLLFDEGAVVPWFILAEAVLFGVVGMLSGSGSILVVRSTWSFMRNSSVEAADVAMIQNGLVTTGLVVFAGVVTQVGYLNHGGGGEPGSAIIWVMDVVALVISVGFLFVGLWHRRKRRIWLERLLRDLDPEWLAVPVKTVATDLSRVPPLFIGESGLDGVIMRRKASAGAYRTSDDIEPFALLRLPVGWKEEPRASTPRGLGGEENAK
jgi:hypothetical protein